METKDKKARTPQKRKAPAAARQTAAKKAAPARKAAPRKAPAAETRKPARRKVTARNNHRTAPAAPPKTPLPEIVYTQPKPFTRNGLLLKLVTVVAVVLALTFGISIFFKVDTITVSGATSYTPWTVREASGIQQGDNLLGFGKVKAVSKILAQLPYVKDVSIGIKLPDTVNIRIEEFDIVYSIRDQFDSWWLITSDGKVVDQVDSAKAGEYTQIMGVKLELPGKGEQAVAAEEIPGTTGETLLPGTEATEDVQQPAVTVPVTVTQREKLTTVLTILQYLEQNEIIGQIATVDVSDMSQIVLWYGERFEVRLGDSMELSKKIRWLHEAVEKMDVYQMGILDISLTLWENEVGYTPFS